jgi:hypothetical protein
MRQYHELSKGEGPGRKIRIMRPLAFRNGEGEGGERKIKPFRD